MSLIRTYKKAKLSLGENSKPTQYKRVGENFVTNRASMHYEIDNDFKYLFPNPADSSQPSTANSINKVILPNSSLFSVGDVIFIKVKFNTNLPRLTESRLTQIYEALMFFNNINSDGWALMLSTKFFKKSIADPNERRSYEIDPISNSRIKKTNDNNAIQGFSQTYATGSLIPDEDFFVVQFVNLGSHYGGWDFCQVLSSSLCRQQGITQSVQSSVDQNDSEFIAFEYLQNGKVNYSINSIARALRFSGAGAVGQDNLNI